MKKLICIFLLATTGSLFAQKVGTVLFTAKKVLAMQNGAQRVLARGAGLEAGDTIITESDATAKIRYLNGTLVTIGPASKYTILAYAPAQSEVIKAQLSQGKIESQTVGGVKRESLKTPVVALSITGTTFKVFVSSATQTNVALVSGEVKAGNQTLHPGESIVALPDGVINQAAFPAAGIIEAVPGLEAAGTGSDSSSNLTTDTGAFSDDSDDSSGSTSAAGSGGGASEVSFISSAIAVSDSVSGTTAVNTGLETVEPIALDIGCFPSDPPNE
jgi:hypothetical protein